MSALVVDIETAGEDWQKIDRQTQNALTDRAKKWRPDSEEDPEDTAMSELGLSPLTGEVVALGVLDVETNKGAVYFQAPGQTIALSEHDGVKLCQQTEKELLEKFWQLSERYTHFVTYNGRTFDIPYLMIRSAIHGLKPTKDLMRNRYLTNQAGNAWHIDLFDQFRFYGSLNGFGSLHLACRAFGIKTPKDGLIDGSKVSEYFHAGRYQEIAEYNARDLFATSELYKKWRATLSF